ncbi:endonuclease/exonuclease/phosphatase family protein [Kribbella sp. NPDC049227]|uniref:endonuclease/exonuclease/phosphatase family protein n=1 Tax=Kribbella sp. NPDC049227 TaxID=3364113 RepID=UPI003714DDBF
MTTTMPPTGAVPAEVTSDLERISTALDSAIPRKTNDNLLIGTWNIRAFGNLTDKWDATPQDSPKRDWHAVMCLAAVMDRFDVTAVQETRRDTTALSALLGRLGPQYHVIVSDVAEDSSGNGERLAYVYDSERIRPSGLDGEIVIPTEAMNPVEQFARTPYAASFVRGNVEFILTTLHVRWGQKRADRIDELSAFAQWMRGWADRLTDRNRNLLVLGDFNLDRLDDPRFSAFVWNGLWPPSELDVIRRTIFDDDRDRHFYDQIAWFSDPTEPGAPSLLNGLTYSHRGGNFDFVPHVLNGISRQQMGWRISDHYPLWVEFKI